MSSEQMFSTVSMCFMCILIVFLILCANAKRTNSQRQLNECNEALKLLVFNTSGKNWGAVLFHKLYAINLVLEYNLLHLEEQSLWKYRRELKWIRKGIEDAVSRSLSHYNPEIEELPVFSGHEKEIESLNDLYTKMVVFAIQSQNDLLQLVGN
ncbi:MAG: hypothetical protein KBT48_12250 [Firmicutes bacterium]|nr:hypothetical protein [Bacillota bacterium]